ncbi:hypothetical protein QWY75_12620 [Pontixanthobacter aestiaquae]|nr:hypothetical protein [Pontixanthobacter aestiaquae]MDN3647048.1 hypothetical protein [Pontixanthobacter aestiaquae]
MSGTAGNAAPLTKEAHQALETDPEADACMAALKVETKNLAIIGIAEFNTGISIFAEAILVADSEPYT